MKKYKRVDETSIPSNGGIPMKVTIIKGPRYEQTIAKTQQLVCHILLQKIKNQRREQHEKTST
jgi:hypothetical protein